MLTNFAVFALRDRSLELSMDSLMADITALKKEIVFVLSKIYRDF